MNTELVALKIAPGTLPAMPGGADVATDWLKGLKDLTSNAYGKAIVDFARFLRLPEAMELPADSMSTEQRRARARYSAAEVRELERKRARARTAAAEALWSMSPGQANGVMLGYRTSLNERGLTPATVRHRLAAVRAMVTTARMLGRVVWTLEVKSPDVEPYRDTAGPGEAGWDAMLATALAAAEAGAPRGGIAKGRRDLALVRLMHDLLLRRGSTVSLDWPHHVNVENGFIDVLCKGRAERERKSLPDRTRDVLADWIQKRGRWPGPLFVRLDPGAGPTPARLTGMAVWKIVSRLGRDAGLPRPTHPHALRHEGITEALAGGMTIEDAMDLSGHRDPKTLMIYRDRIRDAAGDVARYLARK